MLRNYPALPGVNYPSRYPPADVPPIDFLAGLYRLGLKLRDDGLRLVVVGPDSIADEPWWPGLEAQIARWTPRLADPVGRVTGIRKSCSPREIQRFLHSLKEPIVRLCWWVVGGRAEFERLAGCDRLRGVDLSLACLAVGMLWVLIEALAGDDAHDEVDHLGAEFWIVTAAGVADS